MPLNKRVNSSDPINVRSRPQHWLQSSPAATVLMTKLVPNVIDPYSKPGNGVEVRDVTIFDSLVSRRAQKNLDAETILSLTPDLKMIKQIIVSTTLSPVDMTSGKLTFATDKSEIPALILNQVTEVIREHFESYYPLRAKLPEILEESLFDKGSWITVIIPEAIVDDVINFRDTNNGVSNESFDAALKTKFTDGTLKGLGILGDAGITEEEVLSEKTKANGLRKVAAPSLENMLTFTPEREIKQRINDSLSITDNLAIMAMPELRDRINAVRMKGIFRGRPSQVNNESAKHVSTLANALYKERKGSQTLERSISLPSGQEATRSSVGHPLLIKCPSESVIPCYPTGEPRNHIGYIIILDEMGHPIDLTEQLDRSVQSGSFGMSGGDQLSMTSTLIQQTRIATNGVCNTNTMAAAERLRIYNQVLEENVLNRIKNGLIGKNVKMAWNEDIMRIMLFRRFANLRTNIVFVPVEQVAYFAYDYDKNGMGKSLLDDVKQISALRAMTTFANFMAGVKNAVGRTKLTFNIDPRDPDPEKTYHVLVDEYQRMQSTVTPTDLSSSAEMFRTLRMMGTTIETQGNPRMPNTTVDLTEHQSQKQIIDENFTDDLRRQQYMGLIVTPAMVDMTDDADFAITRWTSNQLYAKRIMVIQDDTCKHAKNFVKIYSNSSGILTGKIQKVFRDNNDRLPERYRLAKKDEGSLTSPFDIEFEEAIEEYWKVFKLELPRPENSRAEKQREELNKVKEIHNEIIDAYMNTDMFNDFLPEEQGRIELLRAHLKSYLMRQYIDEQGIDYGLSRMFNEVSEDEPAVDLIKDFSVKMANLMNNFGDYASGVATAREAFINKLKVDNPQRAESITKDSNGGGGGDYDSSYDSPPSGDSDFDSDSLTPPTFDMEDNGSDENGGDNTDENNDSSGDDTGGEPAGF